MPAAERRKGATFERLIAGYPPGPWCTRCGLTAWHWPGCPNTPDKETR